MEAVSKSKNQTHIRKESIFLIRGFTKKHTEAQEENCREIDNVEQGFK